MGVYIKSMEMPKDKPLIIKINPDGAVSSTFDNDYRKYAAIPVPQHGRLIDADVMKTRINCDNDSLKRAYIDWIDAQETIIPASEEK